MSTAQAEALERRRRIIDVVLKGTDVAIAAIIFAAGWFAVLAPPNSIIHTIRWDFLILVWGILLIVGGLLSGVGRSTGLWIVEAAGLTLTVPGTVVYLVSRVSMSYGDIGVLVPVALIAVAVITQIRRYAEIQIFIAEPHVGFKTRRGSDRHTHRR